MQKFKYEMKLGPKVKPDMGLALSNSPSPGEYQ